MFRMAIVDNTNESIFTGKLSELVKIAEDRNLQLEIPQYAGSIIGVTADYQYSCVISNGDEKSVRLSGIVHYDNTCHLLSLMKLKEVYKYKVNGRNLYTDSDGNTISKFSRIEGTVIDNTDKLELLCTMSVQDFLDEQYRC